MGGRKGGSGTVDGLDCSSTSVTNCSTLEQVENDQETSKNATAFLFVSDFLWLSCCLQISQVNLWRKKNLVPAKMFGEMLNILDCQLHTL